MSEGRADCLMCHGRGGWRDAFGWCDCPCTEVYNLTTGLQQRSDARKEAQRSCQVCGGRGGVRAGGKWIKCQCTKPTKEEKDLARLTNAIGARKQGKQQSLF